MAHFQTLELYKESSISPILPSTLGAMDTLKTFGNGDPRISRYVQTLLGTDPVLEEIRMRSLEAGLPEIQLGPCDARLLEVLVSASKVIKAVEIGTLGGYSGLCIARNLMNHLDSHLWTFEYYEHHAQVARDTFRKYDVHTKTSVLVGPALSQLPTIENQGPFDLVFIDADKVGYPDYFHWAQKNLKRGGLLLADNAFGWNLIVDESQLQSSPEKPSVLALKEFNTLLMQAPDFKSIIIPTGEGLAAAVKL